MKLSNGTSNAAQEFYDNKSSGSYSDISHIPTALTRAYLDQAALTEGNTDAFRDKEADEGMVDWQERYIEKLDQNIQEIKNDAKETRKEIHNMEARMADRIDSKLDSKLEEFRSEMRHLDNQRVEDMREIRNSLESTNKHVQSMVSSVHSISIATVIGVAAMVISVLGIWYSVSSNQAEISKQIQQQNVQIQEIQKSIQK